MRNRLPVFLAMAFCVVLNISCAKKTPTLNLLVWEGYADPSYVTAFEDANHCLVSASYIVRRSRSCHYRVNALCSRRLTDSSVSISRDSCVRTVQCIPLDFSEARNLQLAFAP